VLALLVRRPRASVMALTGLLALASSAEATLPAPPFELSVSPAAIISGDNVAVTLRPRAHASGRWDLYVVWLYSERAAFLGPDGAWRPRPVPFRARAVAGEAATVTWMNAGPGGEATLALLTVEPGGDPLERLDWRFRPSLASVRIAPVPAPLTVPYGTVAALAVAAVAAVALVVWPRWPTPPTAAERTRSTSRRPLPADSGP